MMQLAVTVDEMKNYLRVDFEKCNDALIERILIRQETDLYGCSRIADTDEFEKLREYELLCSIRQQRICTNTGEKRSSSAGDDLESSFQ